MPRNLRSSSNSASARARRVPLPTNSSGRSHLLNASMTCWTSAGMLAVPWMESTPANSAGVEAAQGSFVDRGGLHVERDVDPDRPGAAVHGEVDGLLEVIADVVGLEHDDGVLGDRRDDGNDVDFLDAELAHAERLAGDGVEHAVGALDLAGEEEHGGGVEPGAGNAGDGVSAAGAGGGPCRHRGR